MNILGNRIKQRRTQLHMTQGDIAKSVGAAISTVQRYEAGNIEKIKLPVVEAIARALRVNPEWLIGKSDIMKEESLLPEGAVPIDFHSLQRIPILGRISAGMPIYAAENIEGYTYTNLNHGGEYFALRVKGDSMDAARIADGDIVIVRKQDIVEDGEIAVVLIDMQDATMKRFYHNGSSITLMPQSTNPAHKPQIYDLTKTNVTILGKVVKVEFMMD